jgi:hypothetical protein
VNASLLAAAELVVHVFAPAEGPDADECYQELRSLWERVLLGLGLDTEVREFGVGRELPSTLDGMRSGAIAACVSQHPGQLNQGLFRRSHDVLILSAALAPDAVMADTWIKLRHQWDSAGPAPNACYGTVQVCQGLLSTGLVTQSELQPLARSLTPLVPAARTEPPWQDRGCIADGGLAVWETGSIDDARRERQLVVIGPPGEDALLSGWTWSTGDAATTPFTRYLLHAAKLRYEYRVWAEDRPNVQARRNRVSADTASLLGQLRSADSGRPSDVETVSKPLEPCYALEADAAVLIDMASQIQQLKRTVEIAVANLSESAEGSPSMGQPTVFEDDRKLGKWFTAQLDDDATYLLAVKDGAREVAAAVRAAVERQTAALEIQTAVLDRQTAALNLAIREKRDRVSLLQAVVISGAVLCLTAVQALNYHVPLKGGVSSAAVAALSGCALWLVGVVARLATASADSMARRTTRIGWLVLDSLTAGVAVSAVGWALSSWIRLQLLRHHPSGAFTGVWSAVGFVIGASAVATRPLWHRERQDGQ